LLAASTASIPRDDIQIIGCRQVGLVGLGIRNRVKRAACVEEAGLQKGGRLQPRVELSGMLGAAIAEGGPPRQTAVAIV